MAPPHPLAPDLPASQVQLSIALDTTSTCNLRCVQCWMTAVRNQGWKFDYEVMPTALFEKILTELEGQIRFLALSCGFEPFINPDFTDHLEILKRFDIETTCLFTNAMLLRPELMEALIDANLTRMTVSIDGASEESNDRIRKGSKWSRLMANLEMAQETKRRLGVEHPRLRFNWTLMRSTITELPDLVRLAARLGVDDIYCLSLMQYEGLEMAHEAVYSNGDPEVSESVEEAFRLGEELGVGFEHFPTLHGAPDATRHRPFTIPPFAPDDQPLCTQPWSRMRISTNGAIQPCDGWFGECIMGNWAEQTWEEIWNGPAYRVLRDSLWRMGAPHRYCRRCEHWWPNRSREVRSTPFPLDAGEQLAGGWLPALTKRGR